MCLRPQILAILVLLTAALPAGAQVDVASALADRVMGNTNAPVEIIEYASLTCPHCADFHGGTLKELKTRYIDPGKVRLIYRDFPLDQGALWASMLARCSSPSQYFGFIDVLFRSQGSWAKSRDPRQALMGVGRLGGMSSDQITACFENEELLDGIVKMRQEGAQNFNIQTTPTLIINGKNYSGNASIDNLAEVIDPLIPTN